MLSTVLDTCKTVFFKNPLSSGSLPLSGRRQIIKINIVSKDRVLVINTMGAKNKQSNEEFQDVVAGCNFKKGGQKGFKKVSFE